MKITIFDYGHIAFNCTDVGMIFSDTRPNVVFMDKSFKDNKEWLDYFKRIRNEHHLFLIIFQDEKGVRTYAGTILDYDSLEDIYKSL